MLSRYGLAVVCFSIFIMGCEDKSPEVKIDSEIFLSYCKNQNLETYNRLCKGRGISWEGVPVMIGEGLSDDGVRVVIFDKSGPSFAIDSKGLEAYVNRSDLGKLIRFNGKIGEKNTWHPDIIQVSAVKVGEFTDLVPGAYFSRNWGSWSQFETSTLTKNIPVPSLGINSTVPVQTNYYFTNASSPLKRDSNGIVEATFLLKTEKGFIAEYGESTGIFPKITTYKINCSANTIRKIYEGFMKVETKRNETVLDPNTGSKSVKNTPEDVHLVNFWVKNKELSEGWSEASDDLIAPISKACSMASQ